MSENNKIQLNLKGFSGNRIEVLRTNNQTFVRKTVKNENEQKKMKNEILKLRKLSDISEKSNLFKIPKILKSGTDKENLFFYDLEFVPAESLDSSLHKFSSAKLKKFASELTTIINEISSHKNLIDNKISEESFFKIKFNETLINLEKKEHTLELSKELISEYKQKIEQLKIEPKHLTNQTNFCHGDMALDNILITRNDEIYLIDPLMNDFENKMWDYVKILQSSMTHWNLIKYNNFEILKNKIKIKPHEHMSLFHTHFIRNLEKFDAGTIILYLAMTLARVSKYAKNEKQLCALILITNNLLEDYNDKRYDLNGSLSSLRW